MMSKYAKDKRPTVKPVIKAELSEKNKWVRVIAIAVLLVLGVGAIVYSAVRFFGNTRGYTEIKADSVYSDLFVLNYDIGASGASASSEKRRVSELYSDTLDRYSRLLSSDTEYMGVYNIYYINSHPGEDIKIDAFLYSALKTMEQSGERLHYLGTVLELYDSVFSSSEDAYAAMNDPKKDVEAREFCKKSAEYANDEKSVSLKFLEDNTVRLELSDEYAEFTASFGLSRYIDLGVFENAFIVDGIAEAMVAENMTFGAISSYDGYARNLDERGEEYSFSVYGKYSDTVYPACSASYTGKISTVAFKSYPTTGLGALGYYMYADGEVANSFIDKATGLSRTSLSDLLLADKDDNCVSLALKAYSNFTSEAFDKGDLEGASAVWIEENKIFKIGDALTLGSAYSDDNVSFEISE